MNGNLSILDNGHLFQYAVEATPAGIVFADVAGLIVLVNSHTCAYFGYTGAELIGLPVQCIIPLERAQHGMTYELTVRRKDGSEFSADVSWHEIKVSYQPHILAFIVDATQRHLAARLPQERLNAVEQMARGLAHESRNALQRARGCLDLLELDLEDRPEQSDLTERIRRSLDELEWHYEMVRAYASPIVLELAEHDLIELVYEAYEATLSNTFHDLQDTSRLRLQVVDEGSIATNRVDGRRIREVFANVLENAIHASSPIARVLVEISSAQLDDRTVQKIAFTNFGAGIADEECTKIFEPFYSNKPSGTGLGLAISKRIVEAHGGCISATNHGHGVTVHIELPVCSSIA